MLSATLWTPPGTRLRSSCRGIEIVFPAIRCTAFKKWLNRAAQLFILLYPLEVPFLAELMLLFNGGFKAKVGNLFPTKCQGGQITIDDHAGIGDWARKGAGGPSNAQAGNKVNETEANPTSAVSIFKRIILFQR